MTDLSNVTWRKSSFSSGNGACAEVANLDGNLAAVRDSKNPDGPVLIVNINHFVTAAKSDHFEQ